MKLEFELDLGRGRTSFKLLKRKDPHDGPCLCSHSTHDDDLVASLRGVLEELGFSVWADSRELTAGDKLETEIVEAVRGASHLLAVLSPRAFNSAWMRKEIALGVELPKS